MQRYEDAVSDSNETGKKCLFLVLRVLRWAGTAVYHTGIWLHSKHRMGGLELLLQHVGGRAKSNACTTESITDKVHDHRPTGGSETLLVLDTYSLCCNIQLRRTAKSTY